MIEALKLVCCAALGGLLAVLLMIGWLNSKWSRP